MAILKNKAYANQALTTAYGTFKFSAEGTTEVDDTVGAKLATLKGFSLEGVSTEDAAEEENSDEQEAEEEEESETPTADEENAQETSEEETSEETEEESEDETSEDEDADEEDSFKETLEGYNVPQLRKYAKDHNIDLGTASKKQDIIDVIINTKIQ